MSDLFEIGSAIFAGAALILIFLLIRDPGTSTRPSDRISYVPLEETPEQREARRARRRRRKQAKAAAAEVIQQRLNSINPAECNPQALSPLFTTLPGELRNEIFRWALVQYEDDGEASKYSEDSFWFRPGFRGPQKSSSALLRSCRLAYYEGSRVAMKEAEHAFWFYRGPPNRSGGPSFTRYFDALTPNNLRDLDSVRLFTQMYFIEEGRGLFQIFRHDNFRPRKLTITFRYSDWWLWEHDQDLEMSEEWLAKFNGTPGLRQLVIEYETGAWKKPQLDAIVARNKLWKLRSRDGGHFSAEQTQLREWRWRGSSRVGGVTYEHHGDSSTVELVVVVDQWNYVDEPMARADLAKTRVQQDSDSVDINGWHTNDSDSDFDDESDDEHDDNFDLVDNIEVR